MAQDTLFSLGTPAYRIPQASANLFDVPKTSNIAISHRVRDSNFTVH